MRVINECQAKTRCKVAVVVSRFNEESTLRLLDGALERLRERDIPEEDRTLVWVPGAVEIPLAAQRLAQLGEHDAIVCLGAVIRGETDHYLYVCQQVSQGIQEVMLTYNLPIAFGVLTTSNELQAIARSGGPEGNKGKDAVDAALEMVAVLRSIGQSD